MLLYLYANASVLLVEFMFLSTEHYISLYNVCRQEGCNIIAHNTKERFVNISNLKQRRIPPDG